MKMDTVLLPTGRTSQYAAALETDDELD